MYVCREVWPACCEFGFEERSVFLYMSLCLAAFLLFCPSFCGYMLVLIFLTVCLSAGPSLSVCVYMSVSVSLCMRLSAGRCGLIVVSLGRRECRCRRNSCLWEKSASRNSQVCLSHILCLRLAVSVCLSVCVYVCLSLCTESYLSLCLFVSWHEKLNRSGWNFHERLYLPIEED